MGAPKASTLTLAELRREIEQTAPYVDEWEDAIPVIRLRNCALELARRLEPDRAPTSPGSNGLGKLKVVPPGLAPVPSSAPNLQALNIITDLLYEEEDGSYSWEYALPKTVGELQVIVDGANLVIRLARRLTSKAYEKQSEAMAL